MNIVRVGIEYVPSNAYGRAFIEGVSAYAAKQRAWKLVAIRQSDISQEMFTDCDGVIMRVLNDRTERLAKATKTPLVDIYCEKVRVGVGQISSDEQAAGRMAANFFLSRNFIHFAYCGINGIAYSDQCLDAYAATLRAAGHAIRQYAPPPSLQGPTAIDDGTPYKVPDQRSLKKWLLSLPQHTAVFCCNDHRAYQVISVATQAGLDVPADLAVLGCDNDATLCAFAPTPLSSIDPDAYRVGYTAARTLAAMLDKPPSGKAHSILRIPPKGLVKRTSTENIPIEPDWLADVLLEIDRELANGISAQRVFELAQRSPPLVEKVFRKKMGLPVQKYINGLRLKKAADLLAKSALSAKEAAAACGYATAQYFCNAFKAHYGKSPIEYARSSAEPKSE